MLLCLTMVTRIKEKTVTKEDLIKVVKDGHKEHEPHYLRLGPDKHEQEEHYSDGVDVVEMNVGLLESWLEEKGFYVEFDELTAEDQREIWEESGFHFGIYGFGDKDVDEFWLERAKDKGDAVQVVGFGLGDDTVFRSVSSSSYQKILGMIKEKKVKKLGKFVLALPRAMVSAHSEAIGIVSVKEPDADCLRDWWVKAEKERDEE